MESSLVKKDPTLPRSARRTGDSTVDRIWKYYYDTKTNITLNDKEEQIRERLEHVWKLMGNILTRPQIVKKQEIKFGISQKQAYLDIEKAKLLFGDPEDTSKKAKIAIVSHWLEKAMRKALKNDDLKAFEKLVFRYSRINGLDEKENTLLEDLIKNEKPAAIIFSSDADILKKQAEDMVKDVPTVDISHQEVDE